MNVGIFIQIPNRAIAWSMTIAILFCLTFLTTSCSPSRVAGGGGIETVAITVPIPASASKLGATLIDRSSGTSVLIPAGSRTATITVVKGSSIYLELITSIDTILIMNDDVLTTPRPILLVTGSYGPNTGADSLVRAHLMAGGYLVIPVRDSSLTVSDTANMTGIVISTTIDERIIENRFAQTSIPLVNCEFRLQAGLSLTGDSETLDFGSRHPVDTLSIGDTNFSAGITGSIRFFTTAADSLRHCDWGLAPAGAHLIAVDPTAPTHAQVYAIDRGAALHTGTAPARRSAFLFWTADTKNLTTSAWRIFENLTRWTFETN